ncbi:hypothetical protein H0H92_005847, partial [Tricholoma furcatifolium]
MDKLAHLQDAGTNTALVVRGKPGAHKSDIPGHNQRPGATCCKNCFALQKNCRGHTKPFCIQKGGGMEEKTIAEVCMAAQTPRSSSGRENSNKDSSTTTKALVAVTGFDGKLYYIDSASLMQLPVPESTNFAGFASIADNHFTEDWKYSGFMATIEDAKANIDWNQHST